MPFGRYDGPDGPLLMRVLGAILAGGRSSRFGSDKCEFVVGVCGRVEGSSLTLSDRPYAGLGPLGGINAAFHCAAVSEFDAVLSVPADVLPLPRDLFARLGLPGPSHFANQFAVGRWPAQLSCVLDAHIRRGNRSIRSWIETCRSQVVSDHDLGMRNLNTVSDLMCASSLCWSPIADYDE